MRSHHKLLIVSLLLFLSGGLIPIIYSRDLLRKAVFPIQFGIHNIFNKIMDEVLFLKRIRYVKEELFSLYKIKDHVGGLEAEVKELKLENSVLKNQLGVAEIMRQKKIMAYVGGVSFDSLNTTIVLNVGSSSSVSVGSPVIYENYLIGLVSSVSPNSCVVKLLSDPGMKISALSQDTRAKGLVVGNFGTNVLMKNILIDEIINVGETVVTSGEDFSIPKGLIIGKVTRVNFRQQEILKTADIELGVNPNRLEIVFVLGN